MAKYQLTAYDTRSSTILTVKGYVPYEDWCKAEIARINLQNHNKRNAQLIEHGGKIAIVIDFEPVDRFENIDISDIANKYIGRSRS